VTAVYKGGRENRGEDDGKVAKEAAKRDTTRSRDLEKRSTPAWRSRKCWRSRERQHNPRVCDKIKHLIMWVSL
jgi:hypothetical protein